MLLVTPQSDYLPMISSAGVRVAVHAQNDYPFPDAFGYDAPTGRTTSFGVSYLTVEKQPAPYGTCTLDGSGAIYYYTGGYTVEVNCELWTRTLSDPLRIAIR